MNVIQWLRAHSYVSILFVVGVFFILIYSWFYYGVDAHFTSPDETANYYFTELFSDSGRLRYQEPLHEIGAGLIRPRSTVMVGEYVAPGSFLGLMVLYGVIAKIFGSGIILLLTPIISVVGVLFFYKLIKEIFTNRIAFISALLLFILPPFWYYSSRGMFHNILFIVLFIIGLYYLTRIFTASLQKLSVRLHIVFSGLFIGLALFVRTSEISWILPLLIILVFFLRKKVGWSKSILFVAVVVFIVGGFLLINQSVYESIMASGYSTSSIDTSSVQTTTTSFLNTVTKLIFPFGVDFQKIGSAAYHYLLIMFPWFSALLIVGLVTVLKRNIGRLPNSISAWIPNTENTNPRQRLYLMLYVLCGSWLVIYYGSFSFIEHFNRSEIILGSSYLRYWLPIFVFGLPLCVTAILCLSNLIKKPVIRSSIITIFIGIFVLLSCNVTMLDPLQGLVQLKKHNITAQSKSTLIDQITEKDAVIIAGHSDKVFFSTRKVMAVAPSEVARGCFVIKSLLSDNIPLYYVYNPLDSTAEDTLEIFNNYEIGMSEMHQFIESNEVLYKLNLR